MSDKIFNPESGNQVSAKWALSQGIINEQGAYLDDDGQPAALIEIVNPDADIGDDMLQERAAEAEEVAARLFDEERPDEAAEDDHAEPADADDYAEIQGEVNALRGELEQTRDELEQARETAQQLSERLQAAEAKAERYRRAKESVEVRLAEEKQRTNSLSDENDALEEQLDPTPTRTEHDPDGGIRVS